MIVVVVAAVAAACHLDREQIVDVLVELALDARRARGAVEEDQGLLAHVEPEDAAVPRLLELAREEDEAVEVALAGAVDGEAVRRLHLPPVPHLRVDALARQRVDAVELVALHLQPGQHRRLLRAPPRAAASGAAGSARTPRAAPGSRASRRAGAASPPAPRSPRRRAPRAAPPRRARAAPPAAPTRAAGAPPRAARGCRASRSRPC